MNADATPLSRWMYRFRMSVTEFATRCGRAAHQITAWSSGVRRPPTDALEVIARETLREEIDLGIATPRGVPVADWFPEITVESIKAAG